MSIGDGIAPAAVVVRRLVVKLCADRSVCEEKEVF